jgi:CRISPR-associated protein Csx10
MKHAIITFEFLSWWHAGSGLGQGGATNALVIRDRDGLPYLPGKTVKGLLRDAFELAEQHSQLEGLRTATLFGPQDTSNWEPPGRAPGKIQVDNAYLTREAATWLLSEDKERMPALFHTVAATAIGENGVAERSTLRSTEVCPPMILKGRITCPDEVAFNELKRLAPLIRGVGKNRNRGLGRCQVTVGEAEGAKTKTSNITSPQPGNHHGVWLEITLASDVVFSANGATTSSHDSLDYIPGAALAGAAVDAGRKLGNRFDPHLFLGGKVRFGDGMPIENGRIGWPVPLNCCCEKSAGPVGTPINGLDLPQLVTDGKQPQQLRGGYLAIRPDGKSAVRFHVTGEYFLKTARDREKFGSAQEGQLFEFESLPAGRHFLACIRWDAALESPVRIQQIVAYMVANGIRLGRSKNAQFGSATVKLCSEERLKALGVDGSGNRLPAESPQPGTVPPKAAHFYLASDVSLSTGSAPRLGPKPEDFGLDGTRWELKAGWTFLRTRRYSPWVSFHQCRVTERQVLCRGSVITFTNNGGQPPDEEELKTVQSRLAKGVGEQIQDGLGWVLFNPGFVLNLPRLEKAEGGEGIRSEIPRENLDQPGLRRFVERGQIRTQIFNEALEDGLKWASRWWDMSQVAAKAAKLKNPGKSQWSEVRQLALQAQGNAGRLKKELTEFCTKTLRKRFWEQTTGQTTLWQELENVLKNALENPQPLSADTQPQHQRICLSLAIAAGEVIRLLQKNDSETGKIPRNGGLP